MPTCDDCGDHVTLQYQRVFFAEGEPIICPDCTTFEDLCDHNANSAGTAR